MAKYSAASLIPSFSLFSLEDGVENNTLPFPSFTSASMFLLHRMSSRLSRCVPSRNPRWPSEVQASDVENAWEPSLEQWLVRGMVCILLGAVQKRASSPGGNSLCFARCHYPEIDGITRSWANKQFRLLRRCPVATAQRCRPGRELYHFRPSQMTAQWIIIIC